MKNKEIKQAIDDIISRYPLSEIEQGALNVASSKMTSPWVRAAYRMPSKPGLYLCAIRPKNVKNQMAYIVDICFYGDSQEKRPDEDLIFNFYKWDAKYSSCMYPDVIAWMPIPHFYDNKFEPKAVEAEE